MIIYCECLYALTPPAAVNSEEHIVFFRVAAPERVRLREDGIMAGRPGTSQKDSSGSWQMYGRAGRAHRGAHNAGCSFLPKDCRDGWWALMCVRECVCPREGKAVLGISECLFGVSLS